MNAIEFVKAAVAGLSLDQVRELLATHTAGSGAQLVGEGGSAERTVTVALESVYSRLWADAHAGMSCTELAELATALTDSEGFYVSRIAAAESDAIEYKLIEHRHPDIWELDPMPHALVGEIAPCSNH